MKLALLPLTEPSTNSTPECEKPILNSKPSEPIAQPSSMQKPSQKLKPTDEQLHAINIATTGADNVCINALAGSAKTTTGKLIDQAARTPILYIAFNKRIVEEAKADQQKAVEDPSILAFSDTTQIRTFNSIGHGIWQDGFDQKLAVEGKKNSNLLRAIIKDLKSKSQQEEAWDE